MLEVTEEKIRWIHETFGYIPSSPNRSDVNGARRAHGKQEFFSTPANLT